MTFDTGVYRIVQITDFINKQKFVHAYDQYHKYMNYHTKPYNQNMRKKGNLKQPGGSSCNQRR